MLRKRVTAILYGADRQLWNGGPLRLTVTNIAAPGGPKALYAGEVNGNTTDLELDLPFDAAQVYGLAFGCDGHRPAWRFLQRADFIRGADPTERDDLILRLMLMPDQPGTTDVASGWQRLRDAASAFAAPDTGLTSDDFASLPIAAQMACLNIEAKLRETRMDGVSLLSLVRKVAHVAVDRVFVAFDADLKPRMSRSKDFASAPGHKAPAALGLPAHPDSWKHTQHAAGNLQLCFSKDAAPLEANGVTVLVHSADVDIDLGRGLAHAKEWLENNVFRPGHKTNQSLVYGLLYTQNVLPSYVLDPVPATTRATTRMLPPRQGQPRGVARRRVSRDVPPSRRRGKTKTSKKKK